MKRWTSRWAALALGAALVAAPTASLAQTPAAPASQQEATTPAQPATPTQADARQHLAAAESALGRISSTAVTGDAQARLGELRSHVANLRQRLEAPASNPAAADWSKDVAAIDRIVANLLSESPATGAARTVESQPTGTSGSVTSNKAEEAVAIDSETRARLNEVRDAVTSFATAMNRDKAAAPATTAAPSTAPATPAATPATPTTPTTTPTEPSTTTPPTATPPATPAPAAQTAEPTADPATPAATAGSAATAASATTADADASKRALTAARDSLADLTKLPAASQLSGEPRTQVQQLIADFNELITANSNWRSAYTKVDTSLTALIGAQTADESATPVAGNAGAVGTAGTATGALDPTIEAKLVEFRTHLKAFERAAGGGIPAPAPAETPSEAGTSPALTSAPADAAVPAPADHAAEAIDGDAARTHVEALDDILSGAAASSLTTSQIDELKTHVAELKRLVEGDR